MGTLTYVLCRRKLRSVQITTPKHQPDTTTSYDQNSFFSNLDSHHNEADNENTSHSSYSCNKLFTNTNQQITSISEATRLVSSTPRGLEGIISYQPQIIDDSKSNHSSNKEDSGRETMSAQQCDAN